MFGDRIVIKEDHKKVVKGLADIFGTDISRAAEKYVITIAGESGSGKTGIAYGLKEALNERGIKSIVFQQDDYFIYPPKTNWELRRKNIKIVGLSEVRISLLQEHIREFKVQNATIIKKPLVIYDEDRIEAEGVPCEDAKVMIIEGTYVSLLEGVDKKIFLMKSYKDTLMARLFRKRDKIDGFTRKILIIEHKIISKHKSLADIIVKRDYSILPARK